MPCGIFNGVESVVHKLLSPHTNDFSQPQGIISSIVTKKPVIVRIRETYVHDRSQVCSEIAGIILVLKSKIHFAEILSFMEYPLLWSSFSYHVNILIYQTNDLINAIYNPYTWLQVLAIYDIQ